MMSLDLEIMRRIVTDLYVPAIARAHGDNGIFALRVLLQALTELYRFVNPESIKGALTVFLQLESSERTPTLQDPKRFTNLEYLASDYSPRASSGRAVIQVLEDGGYYLWKESSIDPSTISQQAIVYVYSNEREAFIIKGQVHWIQNPSPLHASIFAIPTFRVLEEALEDYRVRSIRTSRCQIFSNVWSGGQGNHRLFFVNKPEELMRKSLTQYLQNSLRGADVQPEVNVDETHPVDIQVTWFLTNRIALIEIKWMGDSVTSSGALMPYREARANTGANQLAEYLDSKHQWAPVQEITGYLVVIDARRKGLTPQSTSVDIENGMWYRDQEVKFDPEYHKIRHDFAKPIRMFAEPICRPD